MSHFCSIGQIPRLGHQEPGNMIHTMSSPCMRLLIFSPLLIYPQVSIPLCPPSPQSPLLHPLGSVREQSQPCLPKSIPPARRDTHLNQSLTAPCASLLSSSPPFPPLPPPSPHRSAPLPSRGSRTGGCPTRPAGRGGVRAWCRCARWGLGRRRRAWGRNAAEDGWRRTGRSAEEWAGSLEGGDWREERRDGCVC
jgi:hypothetical protein